MASSKRGRAIRIGCWVAGTYVAIVLLVFGVTSVNAKPGNLGYDWIPFIMLATPWLSFGEAQEMLIPGLIANTIVSFLIGAFIGSAKAALLFPTKSWKRTKLRDLVSHPESFPGNTFSKRQ